MLRRCVAKLWRSVCGDSGAAIPAWRACRLTIIQNITRDMPVPAFGPDVAAFADDAGEVGELRRGRHDAQVPTVPGVGGHGAARKGERAGGERCDSQAEGKSV